MTSPTDAAADALSRWQSITRFTPKNPVERARIERAERLADQTVADAIVAGWMRRQSGTPNPAGQLDAAMVWSHVALMWHQVLTDTDTFTAARTSTPTACRQDPEATRQWLASPDGTATLATTLGLDEYFDLYGFDKFDRLTKLLAAARDAEVFGIDGHRVEIIHEAGDHGYVDAHRVTLSTPQHGILCSGPIDSLAPFTDHLAGPDAAVHALTIIAEHTDELLAQRALLAASTWPTPKGTSNHDQSRQRAANTTVDSVAAEPTATAVTASAGRAFRPLASDAQPPVSALAPASEPAKGNGRCR